MNGQTELSSDSDGGSGMFRCESSSDSDEDLLAQLGVTNTGGGLPSVNAQQSSTFPNGGDFGVPSLGGTVCDGVDKESDNDNDAGGYSSGDLELEMKQLPPERSLTLGLGGVFFNEQDVKRLACLCVLNLFRRLLNVIDVAGSLLGLTASSRVRWRRQVGNTKWTGRDRLPSNRTALVSDRTCLVVL